GRMRSQDRADQNGAEHVEELRARNIGVFCAGERPSDGALLWRLAHELVVAHGADVVEILGDIGEMRKIGPCPYDFDGAIPWQAVERRLELGSGGRFAIAPKLDRELADALDCYERLLALLPANGVAQDAAEHPDVIAQRLIAVGRVDDAHTQRPWASKLASGRKYT